MCQEETHVKNPSLIAAAVLFAATAAVAQTGQYTATLAQPLTAKKEFIANGNIWRCAGSTCVLASEPVDAASIRSCHSLVRLAGALTTYGPKGKPFEADKLAMCNGAG
jgi:hypothetical protein